MPNLKILKDLKIEGKGQIKKATGTDYADLLYALTQNIKENGKIKLSNGLTIIWGYNGKSNGGNVTINFEGGAFDSACWVVVPIQQNVGANDWNKTTITGKTTTGFSLNIASYGMGFNYIAIGC